LREAGLRSLRTVACSHGLHGLKVTKDGSVLEVNDGGGLQGGRVEDGGLLWGHGRVVACSRPGSRTKECSRTTGSGSGLQSDRGIEWARAQCLEILLSVGREHAVPEIFRAWSPNQRRASITCVSLLINWRHAQRGTSCI
jgi:hypothetical protein